MTKILVPARFLDAKQETCDAPEIRLVERRGDGRGGSRVLCGVATMCVILQKRGNKVGREFEGGLFIFCHCLGPHSRTHTHSH